MRCEIRNDDENDSNNVDDNNAPNTGDNDNQMMRIRKCKDKKWKRKKRVVMNEDKKHFRKTKKIIKRHSVKT